MKKLLLTALIFLFVAVLSACSGSSTQNIDYAPTAVGPSGLDMKAAVYKTTLPSGNTLTITTDQSGQNVNGAYTIKNGATIVSSGTVGNSVFQLTLIGHKNFGNPCPDEAITIVPSNINTARNEADITVSGQKSCSESLLPPIIRHISKPVTATMFSRGTISTNQELSISVVSGDNVNFVGSVTLDNTLLAISATGTIVGTVTNSGAGPDTAPVVEINNPLASGFVFTRATNFSGHFFSANDNITNITGQIKTASLGSQPSINEISVTVFTDITNALLLGPISSFTASQSYIPL